jgi:hypothetical protein
MDLRFVGIDPNTGDDNCPTVFVDEVSGDFVFQGWTVTDPADLAQVSEHSTIRDYETVIRLPARMREILLKALTEADEQGDKHGDGGPAVS